MLTPPTYTIIDLPAGISGTLVECFNTDGVSLGRRYLPNVTNPDGIPAALAADKNPAPLPTIETPDQLRATLKSRASARRWEVETGGAPVPNTTLHIDTDDRTKTLLSGVLMMSQLDETFTTRWKAADGSWHILDGQMIALLSVTISRHVDRCFAREGELHDLIEAAPDRAALEALRPVIEQFWP